MATKTAENTVIQNTPDQDKLNPNATGAIDDSVSKSDLPDKKAETIKKLISDHKTKAENLKTRYFRYKGKKPICTRPAESTAKVNNKLISGFEREVPDVKAAYGCGIPITVEFLEGAGNVDQLNNLKSDLMTMNNVEDLDPEHWKMAAITGVSYELWYNGVHQGKAVAKVLQLWPWEVIPIYNKNQDLVEAIRYNKEFHQDLNKEVTTVEYYDSTNVYYYRDVNGTYYPYEVKGVYELPHMMGKVPINKAINNKEEIGDTELAESYIDAFDRAISDLSSEMEQTRLAYLLIYGAVLDEEVFTRLKQTGALQVDSDGKIEWLIKDVNVEGVREVMDRLEKLIIRFSGSVDFTDKDLYGNLTKMAISYKLRLLESKCSVFERKYTSFLRNRWEIISNYWDLNGISLDYLKMKYTFTRNVPVNTVEEADTLKKHIEAGVSKTTSFAQTSFIDDPDAEFEKAIEEQNAELDSYNLTEAKDNENREEEEEK